MAGRLTAQDRAPVVHTATIDGIIHPVSSEFMRSVITRADASGAALIVFTLHTPGGLLDSTRDIINAMIAAKTPVAVFVGPSGNRAASAGFLITIAADIAAMSPGTHIGAAHPVAGNGEKIDDVMAKKMASDTAAYARSVSRLAQFANTHTVLHFLGAHVENSRTPGVDYPVGTVDQPEEHELDLGRAQLIELDSVVQSMRGRFVRTVRRDFTVWPQ